MSFFNPNNNVERSPSNILEHVQPAGGFSRLAASNASVHMLCRPDEIWVEQSAVSKNVTIAQECV
jgi:hypothetical protein